MGGEKEDLPEARSRSGVPSLGLPRPKASASEQKSNQIPSVSSGPHVPMPSCWL